MKTNRFAHGLNSDGRFNSVCQYCLRRVATTDTEEELAGRELAHHCFDAYFEAQREKGKQRMKSRDAA